MFQKLKLKIFSIEESIPDSIIGGIFLGGNGRFFLSHNCTPLNFGSLESSFPPKHFRPYFDGTLSKIIHMFPILCYSVLLRSLLL